MRVPFDTTRTIPDCYFLMQSKMFFGFPDDVGASMNGWCPLMWIQDNYVIQFNNHSMYYVDIISRDYGSISYETIKQSLNDKLWMLQSHKCSDLMIDEVDWLVKHNPQAQYRLQVYIDVIAAMLCPILTDSQICTMKEQILSIERATGAKFVNRKWMIDGKDITWGHLLYSVLRQMGMKKIY